MPIPITLFNTAVYAKSDATKLGVRLDLLKVKMGGVKEVTPSDVNLVAESIQAVDVAVTNLGKLVASISSKV